MLGKVIPEIDGPMQIFLVDILDGTQIEEKVIGVIGRIIES